MATLALTTGRAWTGFVSREPRIQVFLVTAMFALETERCSAL